MEDLFKKFLYTGVGLAALTTEKLQETVDELVGKGKVSKDEGKKIIDEFSDKVDERRSDIEKRLQEVVDNFSASLNIPKMASQDDLSEVLRRLDAIEAKLNANTAETVKTVVEAEAKPKTTPKRTATRAKKTS